MITVHYMIVIFYEQLVSKDIDYVDVSGEHYAEIQKQLRNYIDDITSLSKMNGLTIKKISANSYPVITKQE